MSALNGAWSQQPYCFFIDVAFLFEMSHDSYLQREERMRQPLAFMADDLYYIMFWFQTMNQSVA